MPPPEQTLRPGLLYALKAHFAAPQHVWISSGTHLRNESNSFMGQGALETVIRFNKLLSRFALLVLIALARSVFWCAEQPGSSVLPRTPYYKMLLELSPSKPLLRRMPGPQSPGTARVTVERLAGPGSCFGNWHGARGCNWALAVGHDQGSSKKWGPCMISVLMGRYRLSS